MKYVMRVRWYRVDGDRELRVSDGGNEREVRVTYERKRCRAGSVVECTLVLDYLLYYCLLLLLLAFTLAYVGLCSLLSKLFTVDILPSSQE